MDDCRLPNRHFDTGGNSGRNLAPSSSNTSDSQDRAKRGFYTATITVRHLGPCAPLKRLLTIHSLTITSNLTISSIASSEAT
jgi:hypothetical protein